MTSRERYEFSVSLSNSGVRKAMWTGSFSSRSLCMSKTWLRIGSHKERTEQQDLSLFDEGQYGAVVASGTIPSPKLLSNVNNRLGRHNRLEH